ncbi:bifunctional 2-polyprenyl-6-hydroxyphenol methylase/3-demethylubiquinol 3-O-methyltransferase UbiG [Agromyces sp. LHK192]|uniref:class I SAM-dependent methyltransferase n=1 Tax=Agromyces sp. LHK192 TaxID=2498704 RepID=UPI000FD79F1F|nr:class I SAM-dependent methyltransferase [Agromyces sp. LHK192]
MTSQHRFDREYYRSNGQIGDRPALRWYTALTRRYLGRGPVLDVGCGTGHFLRRLSANSEADGIEVSEFAAQTARQTSPASRVYRDAVELERGRYTRITSIHVVEHLPDDVLRRVIAEVRASATPDARWLVVTPDLGGAAHRRHGDAWLAFTDPTHVNLKSHGQWREFFEDEGFDILRESSDGLWNNPYSSLPGVIDRARFSLPMAAQFLTGRLFLRPGSGESSVFILQSRRSRSDDTARG